MSNLTEFNSWKKLSDHYKSVSKLQMRDLFQKDPQRFNNYSISINDLLLDYSKNRITEETMPLLVELAKEAGLSKAIEAMYSGEKINNTENRAVLHIALRNRSNTPIKVDGEDVMPKI